MAVERIVEIWKGREADGQLDDTRYVRVFRVWTNNGFNDGTIVGAALEAPPWNVFPGAVHPNDPRAYCISCRPNNDMGPNIWICTATYSTKRELAALPEDDGIEISFDEEDIDIPVTKDKNGKAVLNSAGDVPTEPIMGLDSLIIARIELKAATIPSYAFSYRKAVNSDAYTIEGLAVPAGHSRIRKIALGKKRFRGNNPFRDVTIEIQIDPIEPIDPIKWLDKGWNRKKIAATSGAGWAVTKEKILLADSTEPTEPVLLDGSGQPLADPIADDPFFNEVEWYRLKVFAGNIPGCV